MKKPAFAQKPPSKLAALGATLASFVIFIVLIVSFHKDDVQVFNAAEIEAPTLRDETPRAWHDETGFNLPPVGLLPSLQTAMRDNPSLRRAVNDFAAKDDAEIFADYRTTDSDITAILLLWSGADLNASQKTEEGNDPRVDRFIRRVYGMGGKERLTNNPRIGANTWPRLFAHYKVRLIAQTQGGREPFSGRLTYDVKSDRLDNVGPLNRGFFAAYGDFLKNQRNPAPYRNNLLGYIAAVTGNVIPPDQQPVLDLVR